MKIKSLCKGPHETLGERRAIINVRIEALTGNLDNMADDDPAAPSLISKLDELESWLASMSAYKDNHNLGRIGCGYDMTDLINAIPKDGDTYTYECPMCGNTGTVRTEPEIA